MNELVDDEVILLICDSTEVRRRWYLISFGYLIISLLLVIPFLSDYYQNNLFATIEIILIIIGIVLFILSIVGVTNIKDILILSRGIVLPYYMRPEIYHPIVRKNNLLIGWNEILDLKRNSHGLLITSENGKRYMIHPLTQLLDELENIINLKIYNRNRIKTDE